MPLLRALYLLLFFTLPFSLNNVQLGFGVMLPNEPLQLVIAFLLLLLLPNVFARTKTVYRNPLFIFVILYIAWSWMSCAYSVLPVVSLKYTFIETLHTWVYGFGFLLLVTAYPRFILQCVQAYTLAFIPLLLRSWFLFSQYNFIIDFSAAAMRPFYLDHPLYGACIAFLLPFWFYFLVKNENFFHRFQSRIFSGTIMGLLLLGLFSSFSRAAWLSFIFSVALTLPVYLFRQNVKRIALSFSLLFIVLICGSTFLFQQTQTKEQVKSTSVTNQFLSVFNWTYDVSNLERLNRYKCAARMFAEKPFTGFGNNSFKFTYLAYQKQEEMTRISLREALEQARSGTGGNTHSDYLAALTELGLIGFVFWCGIIISSLAICLITFSKNRNEILPLIIFCSLLTFSIHIAVNNLIHEDKISGLVWMCWGVLLFMNTKPKTISE